MANDLSYKVANRNVTLGRIWNKDPEGIGFLKNELHRTLDVILDSILHDHGIDGLRGASLSTNIKFKDDPWLIEMQCEGKAGQDGK